MDDDAISGLIVDASVRLHKDLGPGLLESVYETLLADRLRARGLMVERQKTIAFEFDGVLFDDGYRVDLLVDGRVIVELKSVEQLAPVHAKQLLTYLRLMNLRVGLLVNFGAPVMKDGIKRLVNGYE